MRANARGVCNIAGDSVLVMDPASNGAVVSNVDITLKLRDGKVVGKKIDGILSDTKDYGISEEFMQRFAPENEAVQNFVSKKIGSFTEHHLHTSCLFRFFRFYRPYP